MDSATAPANTYMNYYWTDKYHMNNLKPVTLF